MNILQHLLSVSAYLVVASSVAVGTARAQAASKPDLRLLTLRDGFRSVVKKGDLSKLPATDICKLAKKSGVQLEQPEDPMLAANFADGRLFYVFYKTLENAFADRPYVIQRIRKTERTWAKRGAKPTERVTYQVEVFKLLGGALKRADQHYGRFSLKGNYRRQILKEYEIGFGEVPDACEGTEWPFAANRLFAYVQRYQEEIGEYRRTKFRRSVRWELDVSLDATGEWRVASKELGFDAPKKMPTVASSAPKPIARSKSVVLLPGVGPRSFENVAKSGGKELARTVFASGKTAITTNHGLMFHQDPAGKAYRVATLPGFLGATDKGVRHGDERERVVELLGPPRNQSMTAWYWTYPGLQLRFDGRERLDQIVIPIR